jgi:hypothetical protein
MAAKKKQTRRIVRAMINLSSEDHAKLKAAAFAARRSLASEGGIIVSNALR